LDKGIGNSSIQGEDLVMNNKRDLTRMPHPWWCRRAGCMDDTDIYSARFHHTSGPTVIGDVDHGEVEVRTTFFTRQPKDGSPPRLIRVDHNGADPVRLSPAQAWQLAAALVEAAERFYRPWIVPPTNTSLATGLDQAVYFHRAGQ
jgi:hypothetical protein